METCFFIFNKDYEKGGGGKLSQSSNKYWNNTNTNSIDNSNTP